MEGKERYSCGACKWITQGQTCCFCANPTQTNESLKRYVYPPFSCDLFDGSERNEQALIDLGYEKKWETTHYASGEVGGHDYWCKPNRN